MFRKFTGKHLCQRPYFNKVAGLRLKKKRLWHKYFPVNLLKFLRTPFLQSTSRRLLLFFNFSEAATGGDLRKRCSWKSRKIYRKAPVVCQIFKNTFLQNTSATATLLKSGTANSVWKTLDECFLSRNTNLKSTF